MNKINFWEKAGIVLIVPAILGLIFSKTLIGMIVLCVSLVLMVVIATIVSAVRKHEEIKIAIMADITIILMISVFISSYYFKRDDIAMYIGMLMLIFVSVFCVINAISKKKK